MSEILPCPFCGGEAEEKRTGRAPDWKYKIVCTSCGCRTGETVAAPLHVKAWNTRAERECRVEMQDGERGLYCSECGALIEGNYCANCGARVAGEQ